MSLNKVQLIGNLGKDPELKQFQNGGQICNVSIATTDKGYTNKDGVTVEPKTEWHNVVFTNKLAGVAAQYLHKGSKIYVEGKLSTRSYDSNGVTKYVTEIRAINMEMLDSKQPQQQQQNGGYQQPQQQQANPYAQQPAPQQPPVQQGGYQQGGYQQGPPPAQNYQPDGNMPF